MNVVLFSATGMIGSRILNELVSRGHRVTAVVRNPPADKFAPRKFDPNRRIKLLNAREIARDTNSD